MFITLLRYRKHAENSQLTYAEGKYEKDHFNTRP